VTTGFIDRKLYLWPDQIHALLQHAASGTKALHGFWQGMRITLGTKEERELAWNQLADRLVFADQETRTMALADLADSLGLAISSTDMSSYEPMSWEQLRELHAAGFEIGDHSYTHACLPMMSDGELERELQTSKALLEANLGASVRSFAYPNGTRRDCSPAVIAALKRAGYQQAVLAVPGNVSLENRFELGRFSGVCSLEQFRSLAYGFGGLRRVFTPRAVAIAPVYVPAESAQRPPQRPR
jgi:peptidoglycan/xylan/chitin deacetylase (PgdA/CDA1 family)